MPHGGLHGPWRGVTLP